MDVLGGASPDYAVIAQQTGSEASSPQLDDLFNQHYGVDTVTLAMRYDEQHEEQLQNNLKTVLNATKAIHAEVEAMHGESKSMHAEVEAMHNESQAAIAEILKQLKIIHTSRSWRLNRPVADYS